MLDLISLAVAFGLAYIIALVIYCLMLLAVAYKYGS